MTAEAQVIRERMAALQARVAALRKELAELRRMVGLDETEDNVKVTISEPRDRGGRVKRRSAMIAEEEESATLSEEASEGLPPDKLAEVEEQAQCLYALGLRADDLEHLPLLSEEPEEEELSPEEQAFQDYLDEEYPLSFREELIYGTMGRVIQLAEERGLSPTDPNSLEELLPPRLLRALLAF